MTIREANTSDLSELTPLFDGYMVFYGKESNPERHETFLRDRLMNKEAFVFLAIDEGGNGMGFTLLYPSFSSVSQGRIYVLNDLFVHPDHRKKGVAAALMTHAAQFAKGKGALRLHLETANDNHKAQSLYEKEGWQEEKAFKHYFLHL